jgi:hypothetical protein
MKHPKFIERRTFIDDRFDILIKKQRKGKATFNELTELDNIVNRYPEFRKIILEEMSDSDSTSDKQEILQPPPVDHQRSRGNMFDLLRSFFTRLLAFNATGIQLSIYLN